MARIYKRKDTWYLDFQYKGRRVRKKIGKIKRMAEFALKDIEVKIVKDELGILRKEIKIDKFIEDYFSYIKLTRERRRLFDTGKLSSILKALYAKVRL